MRETVFSGITETVFSGLVTLILLLLFSVSVAQHVRLDRLQARVLLLEHMISETEKL